MTSVGYGTIQILPSMTGFNTAIDRHLSGSLPAAGQRAGQQLGDGVTGGFERSTARLGGIARSAATATTLLLGASAVAAGAWGLSIAAANEQAEISFTTMLGSAERAQSFLGELRDFAASTPFEFPELQRASSSLISAGIEADKVIPIMTTLGDVTSGMGTGSEGIQRATVALQQMQAAGRIMAEDLNQLRDAGIPVYDLLAAATGKAKEEVAMLAQNGKLGREELDQLMGALESGAGLEKFAGLMDKQSESLTGLLSTAKDVLGQGLATAMEPVVGELKDLLPTAIALGEDAMPKVASGLSAAIDAGKGFLSWVTPLASEVGGDLMPVLEDLVEIGQDHLPTALGLAKGGVEAFVDVLDPAIEGVSALTGFLADHELIVLGVVGAYAGLRLAGVASSVWAPIAAAASSATAEVKYMRDAIASVAATHDVSSAAATVAIAKNSGLAQSFSLITEGTGDVIKDLFAVPDAASRMTAGTTGGLGKIREGLTTTVSSISAVSVGFAAAGIAAAVMFQGISNAHAQAKREIDALLPDDFDERSGDSLRSYSEALGQLRVDTAAANDSTNGWMGVLKGSVELLSPLENSVIDNGIAAKDTAAAHEKASEATLTWLRSLNAVADELGNGTLGVTVEQWVKKLDLDPATMSTEDLATAIRDAQTAAENGTPATDVLAESYKTLADETSTSTEQINAWKSALDAALGAPIGLFDATTAYEEGLASLSETLKANSWGLFGTDTAAGRANRNALSDQVQSVQDLADAYADMGDTDKAAEAIRVGREEIIEAGTAAGISEQQMRDYLDSLGLTVGTWTAQVELSGVEGAKSAADDLQNKLNAIDGRVITAEVRLRATKQIIDAANSGSLPNLDVLYDPQLKTGPPRAAGGPVLPGVIYPINELGEEGFMPSVPGTVIPADQMRRMGSDWSGGSYATAKELDKRPAVTAGGRSRGRRREPQTHEVVHQFAGRKVSNAVGDELLFGGGG